MHVAREWLSLSAALVREGRVVNGLETIVVLHVMLGTRELAHLF